MQDRARAAQKTQSPSLAVPSPETVKQSYTDRLLKAKQRVWEEREKDKEPEKKRHQSLSRRPRLVLAPVEIDRSALESATNFTERTRADGRLCRPESMEARADEFRSAYEKVKGEIAKVIVGHDEIVHGVLTCLFIGGHALLEGVPGLGKTLLVRTLADAVSLDFNRIQFTPDLMPADIIGTNIVMELPDGTPRLRVSARARLLADRARRRDQPSHAQDPVGPARSHARALGDRRRPHPHAQGAVLRDGDPEPDRAGRNLSASRGAARPVLAQAGRRLLDARRAVARFSTAPPAASVPRPKRCWTARRCCGSRVWSAR